MTTLSLFSLNVAQLPYGIGPPRADERLRLLINYLRLQEYDIICLQEVFRPSARSALADALYDKYPNQLVDAECGKWAVGVNSGLVILSKHPIVASKLHRFEYHRNADNFARKGALFARLRLPGEDLLVCTTHLQSGGQRFPLTLFDNTEMTADQIKVHEAGEISDALALFPGIRIHVVVGDFNVAFGSPEYDMLRAKWPFLRDTMAPINLYTPSNFERSARIDHCFASIDSFTVSLIKDGFEAITDHSAVIASVSF